MKCKNGKNLKWEKEKSWMGKMKEKIVVLK